MTHHYDSDADYQADRANLADLGDTIGDVTRLVAELERAIARRRTVTR